MEVAIGVLIGIAIAAFSARRRRARAKQSQDTTTMHQMSKNGMTEQEVDELITVIMPTINNDK